MKKVFVYAVALCLFNSINAMEENKNKSQGLKDLPVELRHQIIVLNIKDNINQWNDIFNFDRNYLKAELDRLRLISGEFIVFRNEELKDLIKELKYKRFGFLQEVIKRQYEGLSKEELNQRLTDLLNNYRSKEDLEEAFRLIIAGANFDIKVHHGQRTALMLAVRDGHIAIVRLLIDKGADVNIKEDIDGFTALISAIYHGHCQTGIVKLLIKSGAHLDIKARNGRTALMIATILGYTDVVKLLIEADADINLHDDFDNTALSLAEDCGHIEIAALLKSKNLQ